MYVVKSLQTPTEKKACCSHSDCIDILEFKNSSTSFFPSMQPVVCVVEIVMFKIFC